MLCGHCGQTLAFENGRGYVHPEGGIYMQYCRWCGWRAAPRFSCRICPVCQADDVRDDHCVLPVPEHAYPP